MADREKDTSYQKECEGENLPKFSSIAEAIPIVRSLEQELFKKSEDIKNFLDAKHTILEATEQQEFLRKQAKKMQAFRSGVYELRNKDLACNDVVWCMLCAKGDRLIEKTDELDSLLRKDKNDLKQKTTLDVIQLFTLVILFPFAAYSLLKAVAPSDSKAPIIVPVLVAASGVLYHYREGVRNAWKGVRGEITAQKEKMTERTVNFVRRFNKDNNGPK
jgi:hypothetical protein